MSAAPGQDPVRRGEATAHGERETEYARQPQVVRTTPVVIAAAVIGAAGVIGLVVGGLAGDSEGFFRAYLVGYTFWLGLGLGSLGGAMVQFLTGGYWGLATRRIFEAGASTLPLLAVLFVPLLFGLPQLYEWARPELVAADPILLHKSIYLNVPLFIARAVVYLAVWAGVAILLRRLSMAQDRDGDTLLAARRLQRLSVVAALAVAFTVSFAAIDWLMSLDADWFSTMYPPMVGTGFLLQTMAFTIIVLAALAPRSSLRDVLTPGVYNDLGSLMLAFLMLWAYMSYFQYLLIWAGNLTDEIPWYLRRVEGAWLPVALGLATFGFAIPFWLLLFRPLKRNPRTLSVIAGLIVLMHVVNVFWLVQPPFSPAGPSVDWLTVAALIGVGGLWLAVFLWQLGRRPLLAPNDPRLAQALEAARGAA